MRSPKSSDSPSGFDREAPHRWHVYETIAEQEASRTRSSSSPPCRRASERQRAGVPHPFWYVGATVNPYCMHCGVKRGDTVDDFRAESSRRREREQNFDDLLWGLLLVIGVVTFALIVAYGGAR